MNPEYKLCKNLADEIADQVRLSPRLYDTFCQIPRTIFVPMKNCAFTLDPSPISGGQWISSPLTVAKMTMALEAENCDNILEIGCGSGYQAAILSRLAHRIFSVERISSLASSAKEHIKSLNINNVNILFADGNSGWKSFAPYERIILSCACEEVPKALFDQLKDNGILVAPIKNPDGIQKITKFVKTNNGLIKKELDTCDFVPLKSGRE